MTTSSERVRRIRRSEADAFVWGDPGSGEVQDWKYVSNYEIHALLFRLGPRGLFRHSDAHKTIYAADVFYYVLTGTLVMHNPETGETQRVVAGEGLFFRRDTWHNGFNYGEEPVEVLDFISPPPLTGSTSSYSEGVPLLVSSVRRRRDIIGRWPWQDADKPAVSMHIIRPSDIVWEIDEADFPALTGTMVSTEHMTVGKIELLPSQAAAPRRHKAATVGFVVQGTIELTGQDSHPGAPLRVSQGDAYVVDRESEYQLTCSGPEAASVVFCIGACKAPAASGPGR
jgi:mannose-6-phosphate isomerase-like protein (cupin superfamily)